MILKSILLSPQSHTLYVQHYRNDNNHTNHVNVQNNLSLFYFQQKIHLIFMQLTHFLDKSIFVHDTQLKISEFNTCEDKIYSECVY